MLGDTICIHCMFIGNSFTFPIFRSVPRRCYRILENFLCISNKAFIAIKIYAGVNLKDIKSITNINIRNLSIVSEKYVITPLIFTLLIKITYYYYFILFF